MISCISRLCHVWNYVHVHVCKTANWRFIIICNCIYSVVINCGWNNNVAVKIVACWNQNILTSSSWLDRYGEFVFTIHVRRDPPHSDSPVRSSILWDCNVTGRLIWFRLLEWTFSTCFPVVVARQWHGRDAVWGFGKRTVGGARDGDWRQWRSSSDIMFTGACEKAKLLYEGCVHFTVDRLFWNLYGNYISSRPLLSLKKKKFSFDNMGPLRHIISHANNKHK